ncbi:MAG: family 78 glycoside hydrolase catalytic domain [Clostridia bacterium]|nr:family 78 glycoside hydrolase catalytic domain [Clostridia bacterium]
MLHHAECITNAQFEATKPLAVFHRESEPFQNLHPAEYENRHILFRRVFTLENKPRCATLSISADDYYKLYVNGVFVTQGPAPGYSQHYYYNDIDIADYLCKGRNVIAVHTYYQGLYNRVWVSADLRHMLICALSCDGKEVLVSDTAWRCREHSGYKHPQVRKFGYDTQFAEDFDSRSPEVGFEAPDYDDSAWDFACIKQNTDYRFYLQPTKQLAIYEVAPMTLRRTACPDGTVCIDGDIGFECVGALTLKAKGLAGTTVGIFCGEELCDDGSVRYNMRCNCTYEEYWTLSGGMDTLVPYDYKGMRYFRLRLPAGCTVADGDIKMQVRHYPYREAISCPSTDSTIRAVWKLCADTIKYAVQEVYMDCPTREKGQYLGDGTVSSAAHLLLTGDGAMMKKALYEYARSTFITDGIMTVAPCSFMQEIADYSMQYPHQLLWYFRHTQDRETLEALAPYCEAAAAYFRRFDRGDGLLSGVDTWNLIDWPENLRDHYDFPAKKPIGLGAHNVINAFWYGMCSDLDEIRTLLGTAADRAYTERVGHAFVREFYDPEQKLFTDAKATRHTASHSNFMPLYMGLYRYIEEDIRPQMVSLIRERGFCMGVYMAYFMLEGLKKAGYMQDAIDMIKSPGGWCNMLDEGATTLYEAWGKDQKWNTSFCHPWAAAPILVLADEITK